MLDAAQMTSFIDELIRNGPVWPAIMLMIQLCMGERADAVRRARVKWFEDIEAEALGAPFINIPKVNGNGGSESATACFSRDPDSFVDAQKPFKK